MNNYDLIVIGSGSGLEVSAEADEMGLSVAVVETDPSAEHASTGAASPQRC